MPVRFVMFEGVAGYSYVYVNPASVAFVKPRYNIPEQSDIYFANGEEFVSVMDSPEEVVKKLSSSACVVAN